MSYEPHQWTVIVPVKELHLAKSRLGELGGTVRRRLAEAFARDTVDAAMRCPLVEQVVVVTNDPVGTAFSELGCVVVPDVPDAGLNPALVYAGEQVRSKSPRTALAAMSSDLPSLRPDDLSAVLGETPQQTWFVADSHGVGTTMVGTPFDAEWSPAFGAASRAAHLARGFAEISASGLDRLRLDVDTTDDLQTARRLGVGTYTARALATVESLG